MRIFATVFAIAALAAAPCAWDSDPREPSLLAALVSGSGSATVAEKDCCKGRRTRSLPIRSSTDDSTAETGGPNL
jgi:hypothetical protein